MVSPSPARVSSSGTQGRSLPRTLAIGPRPVLGAVLVAMLAPALAFDFGGEGPRNERPQPGAWDFPQIPPSNARGMPPARLPQGTQGVVPGPQPPAPQAQPLQAQWSQGRPPGYGPQPQWPQGQTPGYGPQSQWPQGQPPTQPPGQPPGQPAYGQPPGYQRPWQPGYQGGYSQPSKAAASVRAPRIELAITNDRPYVQENVLLRLRLISDGNLERADPELPNTNDFMLQKVEGPTTSSRSTDRGKREILNDFILTLTPLRSGDLELPPIKVTGVQSGSGQGSYPSPSSRYEVSSDPSRIQVRPIMTSVSPWLPLHDLTLTANLDAAKDVQEGQPVTIALDLQAIGATGSQLPSLEGMLTSPDFRVYREQTLTEGGLSADKRSLVGKRTEYYTLVPHSGGRLRMPEVQVAWWNVDKGTREVAGLPIRTLPTDAEPGGFGLPRFADPRQATGLDLLWIPLAGVLLLLTGYWGGVWLQRRAAAGRPSLGTQVGASVGTALSSALSRALAGASAGASRLARRLNPAPALASARQGLTQALPAPARLWLCIGAADREADPAGWCQQFQEQACRKLAFDPQESLAGLADKLARVRPGADRTQIERLMQQLDGALYGRQDLDFSRWKRDLKRSLRPRRGAAQGLLASLAPRRVYLPELNPR